MAINQSLWRLTNTAEKLPIAKLASEKQLEDFIVEKPDMLDPDWMLIGRQVHTDFKGIVDLLALQPDGTPVIIELKRDRTPREVLAQTLDYASWLEELEPSRLQKIYESFSPGSNLEIDFHARFGTPLDEDALSNDHLMVIVAAELDTSTERIVKFLSKRGIKINVLFFQVFQGNDDELLLSRSWFVDPSETQVAVTVGEKSGQWNGEFYVSFGEGDDQSWEDARKYGFITASGGVWYTRTLKMLDPDDRLWVSIPGTGYVGVGRVTGTSRAVEDFTVMVDGVETPIATAPAVATYELAAGEDWGAWFVPVEWIHTVGSQDAVRELGFFGNQNTVAKPKSEKWEHTIETLKKKFGVS